MIVHHIQVILPVIKDHPTITSYSKSKPWVLHPKSLNFTRNSNYRLCALFLAWEVLIPGTAGMWWTARGIVPPNWWWLSLITTVDNIYKPLVLRQKLCGVSPMQCKSWTLMEMGQAPNWLLLILSLQLRAWYQGGGGMRGLLNSHQNTEDNKNEYS